MKTIVSLAIVAGLLVATDFGFAAVAEHQVSQQAREALDLADDPSVTVHGFPFTTQALRGDYGHISINIEAVRVRETLRELGVSAELREVTAPLGDLLDGRTDAVEISDLEVVATIREADVGRLIKLPNLSIEPAAESFVRSGNEDDEVSVDDLESERRDTDTYPSSAGIRLAASTEIGGEEVEIIVYGIIEMTGNAVWINPHRLEFGREEQRTVVPDVVRQTLLPQFDVTIAPGTLPFDVRPTGVAVRRGALLLQGMGEDVTLAGIGGANERNAAN